MAAIRDWVVTIRATPTESGDALLSAGDNRHMFDTIVSHYDLLNGLLSLGMDRYWRRRAVAVLDPRAGGRYLDVGCGTGAMSVALLRREPRAHIVGVDPSGAMLAQARRLLLRAGLAASVQLEPGDACALGGADAAFDGVLSGFCIRNLTDRRRAWAEMRRVTRPGGRIVALELTRPRARLLRWGHAVYSHTIVPLLGRMLSRGQAYKYLTASVDRFPAPDAIVAELTQAGLIDVAARPLTGGAVTVFSGVHPEARQEATGDG